MRIIGIDPGVARLGFGVIDVDKNNAPKFVQCGMITTLPKTALATRLFEIERDLLNVLKKTKPDALACEKLFFQNNAKTAFDVGQARGVVLLSAARQKLEITEFTPNEVKLAVTGSGRADKKQMTQMVMTLLKLDFKPHPDDVADALAIALASAFSSKKYV